MTKHDILVMLRDKHGLTLEGARAIVDDTLSAMRATLVEEGFLSIKDFGTFTVVERASRTVMHPSTQKPLTIPAKRSAKFTLAGALKADLSKK
jgi:DNA-binding protein HU-beta